MRSDAVSCISALACLLLSAGFAAAQESPVGVRAAGMAGAFTAVADDGSAVYWNPGGLASGAFFSLVLDHNSVDDGSGTLIALGTPPVGLSYYRTATGELATGRNLLVAHHAGVTLVQSLADRLAVGATLKLVHGVASAFSTNKVDADVGILATGSLARIGLTIRNLAAPEFRAPGGVIRLHRQVRAGVAVNIGRGATVAADLDLINVGTSRGDWRDVAIGAEDHVVRKAWLRGGIHWNAAGGGAPTAPIASLGGTYAIYGRTLADAQVSVGSEDGNRGWGVGLRFVF
jgi:hypothetical protein